MLIVAYKKSKKDKLKQRQIFEFYLKNTSRINNLINNSPTIVNEFPLENNESRFKFGKACSPDWDCGDWGDCLFDYNLNNLISGEMLSGKKMRICSDKNNC